MLGLVNLFDYYSNQIHPPVYRTEIECVEQIVDDTNTLQIDQDTLYNVLFGCNRFSIKMFFYLCHRMTNNRMPITVKSSEIRLQALRTSSRAIFCRSKSELIRAGLITSTGKHTYYVNPAYAWKGDRKQYIDLDNIPYFTEKPKRDEKPLFVPNQLKHNRIRP